MDSLTPDPNAAVDTSREMLRRRFAALRRIPPERRLALMDDLTRLAQSMARAGLKRRYPELDEAELDAKFCELVLGPELAAAVLEHRRSRSARPRS